MWPEHFGQDGFLAGFDGGLDALEDGGAAGQRFKAAVVAAAAFRTVDIDHHVADFAGGAVEPAVKFAIEDQPAADAGAEENADACSCGLVLSSVS